MDKKRSFWKAGFVVIGIIAMLLCSCSDDVAGPGANIDDFDIVGSYTFTTDVLVYTWVFAENKTYEISRSIGDLKNTGTWSVSGNNITLIDTSSHLSAVSIIETFSIAENGNQVTLALTGKAPPSLIFTQLLQTGASITLTRQSEASSDDEGCTECGNEPCTCENGIEIAIEMVQIPAGTFTMGSNDPNDSHDYWSNASPTRQVTLSAFRMGKYEITQKQYTAVMGTNPSYFHGGSGRGPEVGEAQGRRPVEQVRWYNAIVFCNKLSIAEGLSPAYNINGSTNPDDWGAVPSWSATWDAVQIVSGSTGYRLPTEAQWEYAARAGTSTAYSYGDTANGDYMWFWDNSGSRTHEVGKKLPNPWGLYDMHGNVWEWCWDWWSERYPNEAQTDPTGAVSGSVRVARGGSWNRSAASARSALRDYLESSQYRSEDDGFRVVRP